MSRHGLYTVVCLLVMAALSFGADSHRVVVLDAGGNRGAGQQRLRLVEVESGKELANVELGAATNVGVSPDGRTVAALTLGGAERREARLRFYRTDDLSLIETSALADSAVLPGRLQTGYAANIHFSPDQKEIVYCGLVRPQPGTRLNVDFGTTAIVRLKRRVDGANSYRPIVGATISSCRGVDFVNLNQWPKIVVLNQTTSELLTIDLDRGDVVHSLTVAEPAPGSFMPMRLRGICLSDEGRIAYFLPCKSGLLKKIDLSAVPQVMIARGAGECNVRQHLAAVSERAGRIFVLDDRRNPMGDYQPARTLKIFGAADLRLQQEIEVPLADCHWMAASRDGKYLYAIGPVDGPPFDELSITQSRLAVVDASSGREVKILEAGQRPALVFSVADQ